ncbi:rod shape-determining protein MreC [Candidatus Pelagibacter sp. HIMB1506]|uniref:rod shape-determining protein MreC n=1 Tax=Candidatus Pelagibacter sp. HIMB1506 TaxID=3413337 RepID=UPI003F8491F5
MVKGRDDFVIALRSVFLKKKDQQKFSLISLIVLSVVIIILSNFNFKPIQLVKLGINEVIYRSSYVVSVPENKIEEVISKIKSHFDFYKNHQNQLIKIENTDEIKVLNTILTAENKRLRELIDESINSEDIFARVLIDRESPYLKSIVLNRGTKDNVKMGMAVMDRNYLVGQIIEVNYSNSRALLLSDLNSKIPVLIQPPFLQAVASGTGKDHGVIEYTKDEYKENQIEKEAVVYTSGLAGIFKPGIPVGKITNSSDQLSFFSDFGQLSFVKIVQFKIGEGQ